MLPIFHESKTIKLHLMPSHFYAPALCVCTGRAKAKGKDILEANEGLEKTVLILSRAELFLCE